MTCSRLGIINAEIRNARNSAVRRIWQRRKWAHLRRCKLCGLRYNVNK